MRRLLALSPLLVLAACGSTTPPSTAPATVVAAGTTTAPSAAPDASAPVAPYAVLTRAEFNRFAVRRNLPVYWVSDADGDGVVDPGEVVTLLFYPTQPAWVQNGAFTADFATAYQSMVAAKTEQPADARARLVTEDLDQGRPTLVRSDLRELGAHEKAFVGHVLEATKLVDQLYATQNGSAALASQVPADDAASQSLFRRNWGPRCLGPKTEKDPQCSAIPGAPKPVCDAYPAVMQTSDSFCDSLEKGPGAKALLGPFTVVRSQGGKLVPVADAVAYRDLMGGVATALTAAASELSADPSLNEQPLVAYLTAAAGSFTSNDWLPADEAWAKMSATSSKWYLRVAPDEVYWDPCEHKAGFHVTFARINKDSLSWQNKLAPVEQAMEQSIGAAIGAPYAARKVTFHLPDFIDIVWNGGDDRNAMGATVGESLPNWGKVANEGRSRTVAMSNLYTDDDSMQTRHLQASSLLDTATMANYVDSAAPELLSTILHEATHNLGPAHEYSYRGKTDADAFGGGMASMLEELKAQTGALYFTDYVRTQGIATADLALQSYTNDIVWAFGHISRGMWTPSHQRKSYSQLAAIQIGFLLDEGALSWDPQATAANGTDKGAFTIHFDKMPAAAAKMMHVVGLIKATADLAGAQKLSDRYVDGDVVPQAVITERFLRAPKSSFVYAVDM